MALFARAGLSRAAVDADVAKLAIHELPSARGCTYVIPACDYALALRAGLGKGDAAAIATAKKYLGVTDAEIERLCEAIVGALSKGPLDPRALKEATGSAVRHLGDLGKKKGVTTTLSLGLGKLQSMGEIRRVPTNGRLDQQRYAYALWRPSPARAMTDAEVAVELARRFFRWIGPATLANFSAWSALTVSATKAAAAELGLVPLAEADPRVIFPDDLAALRDFRPPSAPRFALVGSIDNISHLRRDVAGLLAGEDADLQVQGEKGQQSAGSLSDLPHHAILDRGRLVGLWDFDVASNSIVAATFRRASTELAAEIARTEAFVRDDLGDARSFSLDSPESREARIGSLRKPPWKA